MPRRFSKIGLFVLVALAFTTNALAQQSSSITGNFSKLSFDQFVKQVEANSSYHFYYKASDVDSLVVNVQADQTKISDLLQTIFKNTTLRFSIDTLHRIFITQRIPIYTSLPPNFFDKTKTNIDSSGTDFSALDIKTNKQDTNAINQNKIYKIGTTTADTSSGKATIAGYVRDTKTGEPIAGALLSVDSSSAEIATDQFGYYSVTVSKGSHVLSINSLGMKEARRRIIVYADGKLNIELTNYVASLRDVVVLSERRSNVKGLQMGLERLSINTIKQVPVVFGEADVLKVVLTLPGVTSAGEASTGFNVRGGATDQNLILFGDATIYNPSHLFGFFSAFNPDVVKGVELYKSTIPEKFGGRLSSVLDVETRDGNSKKLSGNIGLGPLTSKITLEGPIKKDKTSFIISGRTTYSDWLLRSIKLKEFNRSQASFSDFNVLLTHNINTKNTLYLTGYASFDRFRLNSDTLFKYGNKNANIKWKHIYNNKLYSVFMAGYDHYQYAVSNNQNPVTAYKLSFAINQASFKTDFTYSPDNKHKIDFGLNEVYYLLHPGSYQPADPKSLVKPDELQQEKALESALYLGDQYSITSKLSINAGLRYSIFTYLGAHDVYNYVPGLPKTSSTIQDTTSYDAGKVIKTYGGPEYRLAMRYAFTNTSSVKLSYNTLRQYIHLLTNTTVISPTDVWKLSDPNIKPQLGDQVSVGFYNNFKQSTIETSVEVYYKRIRDYLDYKSGASLVMNHHIETDVVNSRGKAYGAEVLVKKTAGKLNGWLSYTYSRTFLRTDDNTVTEKINGGAYYPANFDKPHNVNVIANYRFSHRFSLSANLVYSTGRPITLPIAIYDYGYAERVYYSDRNQYRIPDYFRSDLSFIMEGNHNLKQKTHNSWSFGVYNLTARKNAYSVYFTQVNGQIKGYQLSIFGTLIPFVTYNIRF